MLYNIGLELTKTLPAVANKENKRSSSLHTTVKIFQILSCLLVFVLVTAKTEILVSNDIQPHPAEELTHTGLGC